MLLSPFPPGMWDEGATRCDNFSKLEVDYTRLQVQAMHLRATDRVLDIGYGSDRLSVPVAARVSRVTALDGSALMLERVEENAKSVGQDNIARRHLRWEEVVIGANVSRMT